MFDEPLIADWKNPRGEMPVVPGVVLRIVDKEADYPIVAAWWQAHGWAGVPAARLPALGVVASMDGLDCAAAWCYMDNSGCGVAMVEWIVSNPEAPARAVVKSIRAAVDWLMWRAGECDLRFDFFLATCRQPALARLLEKSGFTVSDSSIIHLCAS